MSNQLQTHPLVKTFDELQRSIRRLENYIKMHEMDMSEHLLTKSQRVYNLMQAAVQEIPEEYQLTRWEQLKREGRT